MGTPKPPATIGKKYIEIVADGGEVMIEVHGCTSESECRQKTKAIEAKLGTVTNRKRTVGQQQKLDQDLRA